MVPITTSIHSVTFKGATLKLAGRDIKENASVLQFKTVSADLTDVTLDDFKGAIKLIHSFPSLDTPVCDLQVKEFNKRAEHLSDNVVIIGISKDLPFAQKRFCDTFSIGRITVLSDYKNSSFGIQSGLLVPSLNLLARAVLIADAGNVVRYLQIAPEMTASLDFDDAFRALAAVTGTPSLPAPAGGRCLACHAGAPGLSADQTERLLAGLNDWQHVEAKKLVKDFHCKDFVEAKSLYDCIARLADEHDHHPVVTIGYRTVKVTLTTHAVGGLSENDFIMARLIDELKR